MPPRRSRAAAAGAATDAAPDALRCGLSAAQLAKLETLEEASDTAELAALLAEYTETRSAARFDATTRDSRAGNRRMPTSLRKLDRYPALSKVRCCVRSAALVG